MAKRSYTEADKASALALLQANAGNAKRTANELRMPMTTLRKWRDGFGVSADVAHKRDEKKRDLADIFEDIARAYATRALDSDTLGDTKGKDAVIAAATAVDKLRLLRGEATEVTEVRGSDAKRELADRLARLAADRPEDPRAPN